MRGRREGRAREPRGDTKEAQAAKEAWEAKKAALAKKTFDARASPYVENL
ncbi:putative lipoprotein [Corallococcus coralloides]|uniref:Putative lipoprotein n=1 Tax=Corallococcus coralloides TaxID=184914 RepID=A0A410RLI7_CORCK|nr:hypothetical protein [Corallococcus coralloides]QAT82797.1 putative lipoprotein [Corallococcus coralloides]